MNQVILEGTAERNADFRLSQAGNPVANLRLKTEAMNDKFDFHTVVAFGEEAQTLGDVTEGTSVRVEGRLKTRSFEGRDGNKRTVTEVIASSVKVLTSSR